MKPVTLAMANLPMKSVSEVSLVTMLKTSSCDGRNIQLLSLVEEIKFGRSLSKS
jgi:hypothetical protein